MVTVCAYTLLPGGGPMITKHSAGAVLDVEPSEPVPADPDQAPQQPGPYPTTPEPGEPAVDPEPESTRAD
jgi:hypothetical protein